ncbi:MAG: twin-arginine translocase TatA/TatE family subunit [Chthoniobacterales bacterium]
MFVTVMSLLALLSNFGGPDLIIILLIVLVLFGAKKLPELAKGMGLAVKEFQKAKDEFSDELHNAGNTPPAKPDVRSPDATVPRIDNAPTAREVPPAQDDVARSAEERASREV